MLWEVCPQCWYRQLWLRQYSAFRLNGSQIREMFGYCAGDVLEHNNMTNGIWQFSVTPHSSVSSSPLQKRAVWCSWSCRTLLLACCTVCQIVRYVVSISSIAILAKYIAVSCTVLFALSAASATSQRFVQWLCATATWLRPSGHPWGQKKCPPWCTWTETWDIVQNTVIFGLDPSNIAISIYLGHRTFLSHMRELFSCQATVSALKLSLSDSIFCCAEHPIAARFVTKCLMEFCSDSLIKLLWMKTIELEELLGSPASIRSSRVARSSFARQASDTEASDFVG